jgi:hypothetical protein
MWQYSIFGSEYLGFAEFSWRIVCPFHVKNVPFLGEMMQNHRNKARRHGVPEFMVIDMEASLAIGPIRLS